MVGEWCALANAVAPAGAVLTKLTIPTNKNSIEKNQKRPALFKLGKYSIVGIDFEISSTKRQ